MPESPVLPTPGTTLLRRPSILCLSQLALMYVGEKKSVDLFDIDTNVLTLLLTLKTI